MKQRQGTGNRGREGGWTLIHCLILMALIMFLGDVSFRIVAAEKQHVLLSAWGRSAEALADGALEMALAHLESGGGPAELLEDLATGSALAAITPSPASGEYEVHFSGTASSDTKIRMERHYRGTLFKGPDGGWKVRNVRRASIE
jgi:hypothetical protein